MVINTILASNAFDPYPFILLNLVLSCVAAIQAPLIMMSQNRQEGKGPPPRENDYKVNLKTEIMIEDLYDKVNAILAKQSALEKKATGAGRPDEILNFEKGQAYRPIGRYAGYFYLRSTSGRAPCGRFPLPLAVVADLGIR